MEKKIQVVKRNIKVPSPSELLNYKVLKNSVRIELLSKAGNIPKGLVKNYEANLLEKTKHIFTKENVDAYKSKKIFEKQLSGLTAIKPKILRLELLFELGYGKAKSIFFEYFLDFRTRIYGTGYPAGLSGGLFKHCLQTKVTKKIFIKSSPEFKNF